MPKITINGVTMDIPQHMIDEYKVNSLKKQRAIKKEINNQFNSLYLEKYPKEDTDEWRKEKTKALTKLTNEFKKLVLGTALDEDTQRRVSSQDEVASLFDNRRLANSIFDENNRVFSLERFSNTTLREGFRIVQPDKKRLMRTKTYIEDIVLKGKKLPDKIEKNVNLLLEEINDMLGQASQQYRRKTRKHSIGRAMGVVDVSLKNERKQIYDYWKTVAEKEEPEFLESLRKLSVGLSQIADEGDKKRLYAEVDGKEIDISELEAKEGGKYQYGDKEIEEKDIKERNIFNSSELRKFLDRYNLYQKETGASPEAFDYSKFIYIGNFPFVDLLILPAPLRFYKLITKIMRTKGLIQEAKEREDDKEERPTPETAMEEWLNTLGGDNEYTGATIDLSEAQEGLDEISNDEVIEEFFKGKGKFQVCDPLLGYEYNKGEKLIGIIDKQAQELNDTLGDYISQEGDLEFEVTQNLKELRKNILETVYLDNTSASESGEVNTTYPFALPIFVLESKLFDRMYKQTNFKVNPVGRSNSFYDSNDKIGFDNINFIKNFLNDLGEALLQKNFRLAVGTRKQKKRTGSQVDSFDRKEGQVVGSSAERPENIARRATMYSVFNSIEETLKDFFAKAEAYYFDPLRTDSVPISTPSYWGSIGGITVNLMNKELGNERKVAPYDGKTNTKDAIRVVRTERILAQDFEKITSFLDKIDGDEVSFSIKTIKEARRVAVAFSKLGPLSKEESYDFVALLLHNTMDELDDFSLENKRLDGKSIKDRVKDTKKGGPKGYRLELLKFLEDSQGLFTDRVRNGVYDRELEERYFDLMESLDTLAKGSPLLMLKSKILKAHDAIRKQLGKRRVFSFNSLTYDNIDKIIEKMYREENLDLSHMEVENIVKEVDSFDTIGREHGISSDHVYLLKAQFRNRVW